MPETERDVKRSEPHWYRVYVGECPVCGRDAGSRERVPGPRPERWEDRHVLLADTQTYDHCLETG